MAAMDFPISKMTIIKTTFVKIDLNSSSTPRPLRDVTDHVTQFKFISFTTAKNIMTRPM